MSVFDLFRRFFHPPGVRDPFFGGMTLDDGDDDDDDDDDDDFFQPPFRPRGPPSHDPFGFEDIFRDFNELFADFGSAMRDVPRKASPERSGGGSLRDAMLKHPEPRLPGERAPSSQDPGTPEPPSQSEWLPQRRPGDGSLPSEESKQDKALDSEVSSRGLDSVLRPREPATSSFFRSVSVSKFIRPDGTVEEKRTVRDGQGNTTTTVTVTRGDEVISSGSLDSPRDAIMGAPDPSPPLPDLSDTQTILSRILQRWFSGR
ncbi:HCLS1-associated protein X-1 [Gastrophryne carolinensis]